MWENNEEWIDLVAKSSHKQKQEIADRTEEFCGMFISTDQLLTVIIGSDYNSTLAAWAVELAYT